MNEITFEVSSGNVFQDLGLLHPEERLLRADLAHRIATIIEDRHLTQREAAALLGINQPKVSALQHGHLEGFSPENTYVVPYTKRPTAPQLALAAGAGARVTVKPRRSSRLVRRRAVRCGSAVW